MDNNDIIVDQVKGLLPTVLEFMQKHKDKINDFDYGCLVQERIWEASFFNVHDNEEEVIFYFTAPSDIELIEKIKSHS